MRSTTQNRIDALNRKYGSILDGFENKLDDRRLAYNIYQIALEAIRSLDNCDNIHIRVAAIKAINNDLRRVDAIILRFTGKVYAAGQWGRPEDVPRVQAEFREKYGHDPADVGADLPSVTCFAVTSYRHYESDETYFGLDGLFSTEEAAAEYIRKDIDDTVKEADPVDDPDIDYDGFHAEIDGNIFDWQIEPVQISADIAEMCFTAFYDAL